MFIKQKVKYTEHKKAVWNKIKKKTDILNLWWFHVDKTLKSTTLFIYSPSSKEEGKNI